MLVQWPRADLLWAAGLCAVVACAIPGVGTGSCSALACGGVPGAACIDHPLVNVSVVNSNSVALDYDCYCPQGKGGRRCEVDIDECWSRPCSNGGTCVESGITAAVPIFAYVCQCAPGWSNTTCSDDVDECASAPCANGGACVDSSTLGPPRPGWPWTVQINAYACHCVAGFEGDHCGVDVAECSSSPCAHGGTCIDSTFGQRLNGTNESICEFTKGDGTGGIERTVQGGAASAADCAELVLAQYPEANGVTYSASAGASVCIAEVGQIGTNANTNVWQNCLIPANLLANWSSPHNISHDAYICLCVGWNGFNCEVDIDECASAPCQNGGVCMDSLTGATRQETLQADQSLLSRVGDPYFSELFAKLSVPVGAFMCVCAAGWDGDRCQTDIDECSSGPCYEGAPLLLRPYTTP